MNNSHQPQATGPIILALEGGLERDAVGPLRDALNQRLNRDGSARIVVCDVGGLVADLSSIDALARIRLTAARHGALFFLRNASGELRGLIALIGLSQVLPLEPPLSVELQRQAEQREQPRRVEEERDAPDPRLRQIDDL